jgi:hypothetical protein
MAQDVGGWVLHHRANPKKSFKAKVACPVCKQEFKITLSKNMRRKDVNVVTDVEFSGNGSRTIYERAIQYSKVCPNCGASKEIFCVPTHEIIKGAKEGLWYMW